MFRGKRVVAIALAGLVGTWAFVPRATAQDLTTLLSKFLIDVRAGVVGSAQPFSRVTVTDNAIATTFTDGIVLQNTTASTAGVPEQISPRFRWCGSAYNSVSAASEIHCWIAENVPTTAAGATLSSMRFSRSVNGGAYTIVFTIFTNGTHRLDSAGTLTWLSRVRYASPANGLMNITNSAQTIGVQFNNTTVEPTFNNGTITTGSRNTAGQVTLTGGSTGGVLSFGTPAWTVAPACTITGSAATDTPNITAASTTSFTIAGITANGVFTYNCIGSA